MNKFKSALAALALTAAIPAHANLLVDGGFEQPVIATGSYSIFTASPGWVGAPDIEIQNHIAGSPFEGNQFVELDTTRNSSMYQDFTSQTGAHYTIHFQYSPRPGVAASSNGIEFYWNGMLFGSFAFNGIGNSDTMWNGFDFTAIATGSTSRVEFRAIGASDSVGGYIDNVSVAAVPEPETLPMLALGLIAAVGAGAARRRKTA
jgi:hypothetical protein